MPGNSEKAAHYISLLDSARVNASWAELPELIRKVTKHAPQRKVLIHTATAEHEVATGSKSNAGRPTTSAGSDTSPVATLSRTLHSENEALGEDIFQGKTCLLWSHWTGPEANAGTTGFDIATATSAFGDQSTTTWTKICIVKSSYIEGTSYMRNGRPTEAQKAFNVALSMLQSNQELVMSTPQLSYWAEQLLAQQALGSGKQTQSTDLDASQTEALKYWGIIASKTREVSASSYKNSAAHLSRLSIWKRYYTYLSSALWRQSQPSTDVPSAVRTEQATELRRVERAYESELLRVVKFPTAVETNATIEEWVEQAIQTWQLLSGPHWRESQLGEGGRNAIARNMLDILYRAATKTFHSTLILRRLFQVHLSLGEFELAYRAFDTYIELVDRGRVRIAKSNKSKHGHESDETVLATMAEAITGLCKFGRRKQARKAHELCSKLEDWLVSIGIADPEDEDDAVTQNGYVNGETNHPTFDPQLLQTVYRAIGTAKAHWARWTPANENRTNLQQAALQDLRKASTQGEPELETLYTTSLLLAETRNISGAISYAKLALSKSTSSPALSSNWTTERKLISQWHLLALLLSSKQDIDSAAKGCVAAFEQFATSDLHLGPGRNASVISDVDDQFNSVISSFASEMECDELQRIIEVRITELALIELVDGPEEAVNSSNELLSLFSRLFAHLQIPIDAPVVRRNLVPPKSSAGTVKSTRASIFGRKKHEAQAEPLREKGDDLASIATDTTRPDTRATQAPTIQVTNEDEKSNKQHHFRKSYDSTRSKGSRRLSHRLSQHPPVEKSGHVFNEKHESHVAQKPQLQSVPSRTELNAPIVPLEHSKSVDSKQSLPEVSHNLGSHNTVPPPASHGDQPPEQDVRLPTLTPFTNATSPPPRFPKSAGQKQALTILAKVWLVIATLYRRASMYEDSKEACDEAGTTAAKIETIVGAIDHSARAFAEAGWGAGNKSADEVWADVYCERAELQLAIYQRKVKEDQATDNEELRAALEHYEQCLLYVPDHPAGVVGLSNVLLDSYERKIDLGRRVNAGRLHLAEPEKPPTIIVTSDGPTQNQNGTATSSAPSPEHYEQTAHSKADDDLKKTPENLNRIAARDRAYGLLSTLTKLGTGWDDSEAWFALARAHELGGEVEKAKSVLWWCIELEDTKPIRHWRNLGYVL